jgi:hypothetical protein
LLPSSPSILYYTPIGAIAVAATVTATQLFLLPTRQIFWLI